MGKIGVGALKPNKVKVHKTGKTLANGGSFGRKMGGGTMPKASHVYVAGK